MVYKKISFLFYICNLQLATAQQIIIENPSASQCIAAPCSYIGDCRSNTNECGEGVDFCNDASMWVPACGGGGTLEKDGVIYETTPQVTTPQTTDPTRRPTAAPQQSTPAIAATTTIATPDTLALSSPSSTTDTPPSPAPTTAWHLWINGKENENKQQGVVGITTGREGDEDWKPSNETGWFDPDRWDSVGREDPEEEESFIDKINPFHSGATPHSHDCFWRVSTIVTAVLSMTLFIGVPL
jgi:hypothetical protein|mmetsp:Transcript_3674/g.8141  ORF Transcript_3674/g.8141 Transcript_3674/m.8141 type:complete len:241 (-) Transcript_3674:53-775(-)